MVFYRKNILLIKFVIKIECCVVVFFFIVKEKYEINYRNGVGKNEYEFIVYIDIKIIIL